MPHDQISCRVADRGSHPARRRVHLSNSLLSSNHLDCDLRRDLSSSGGRGDDLGTDCHSPCNAFDTKCDCNGSDDRCGCNIANNIIVRPRNIALSRCLNGTFTLVSTGKTSNIEVRGCPKVTASPFNCTIIPCLAACRRGHLSMSAARLPSGISLRRAARFIIPGENTVMTTHFGTGVNCHMLIAIDSHGNGPLPFNTLTDGSRAKRRDVISRNNVLCLSKVSDGSRD